MSKVKTANVPYADRVAAGNVWTRVSLEQKSHAIRAGKGKYAAGVRACIDFWAKHHPTTEQVDKNICPACKYAHGFHAASCANAASAEESANAT